MCRRLPPVAALLVVTVFCSISQAAVRSRSTAIPGNYSLILVDTNSRAELAETRDFIAAQGGTVAVVVPPHSIMAWITPEVAARIRGRNRIRSIHTAESDPSRSGFDDRETQITIKLFNDLISGRTARKMRREASQPTGPDTARPPAIDCSLPHPSINRADFLRNLSLLGVDTASAGVRSSVRPQFLGDSDVMDGSVAVCVFLVESNGGIDPNVYSWSQDDQTFAISQVIEGLNWWVEQSRAFNLARPLQFTVVPFLASNPACQQPYEPVLHPASDANAWIDRIMNNFGATAGDVYVKVGSFNEKVKAENHTNWAYSMFINYNPAPAPSAFTDGRSSWAYIGGPMVVSLFRSFGWPLWRIAAHETGHIFYACDEYSQPGYFTCSCTCAPEVRQDALNGNCQDVSCGHTSVPCMMRLNDVAICPFTVAQIGWTAAVPKPPPTAPSGLLATASGPNQVSLIWQDTSSSEDGFQIERQGGSTADFSQIAVVAANSTSYSDATAVANTSYTYRVRAFNATGISDYSNQASVVTPQTATTLSISTTDLPEATVDVAYSRTLVASGGKPDYTWTVDSGALPAGLSLSQTGTVSGTPTAAGSSNVVIRVTDSQGSVATKALSIAVRPAAPLTIATQQLPRGSIGSTYSQSIGASGGQTPYTWTLQAGSLPDGLIISHGGVISGIPEHAGTFSFTIKVTDASGSNSSTTLAITINPNALALTLDTQNLSDAVVGEEYADQLQASGGSAPYNWEISSGALPDGVTLSASGALSGTPVTQGESQFEITVRDQSGQSVSRRFSIDVDPPPQLTILTPPALPVAAVGSPYRVELKATAGTEPYKWAKKKKKKFGSLPEGVSIGSDGVILGVPTTQNTYRFTILVTDSADRQASRAFTLEVGPPPPPLSIRTDTLPPALQGLPYNAAMEAFGGAAPYAWSIDGGTLPIGLQMNSAGLVTGRATQLGAATFTARVRDAVGTTTSRTILMVVQPPPPPLTITTQQLGDTTADRPYSQSLQATGGVPPYTWSLSSGSLGTGLNLSASGLISGTPPTAATNVFVVRVSDAAQQTATRTLAILVKPADRIAPFGSFETPDFRATLNNTAIGTGWALDNVGVTAVEVLIDGNKVGDGQYGLSRPDIAVTWSSFPNASFSGFQFSIDTTRLTNGEHTLAVRVSDASGNSTVMGTRTVQVQNRVLTVATTELVRPRKNSPYSFQLGAINGQAPYTWTLASGSLPSGLSLNVSGLISGTPTVFGTFTFSVRVTDSHGATAVASLTLTVIPDIEPLRVITSGPIAQGTVGVAYSYQLLYAGGVAPRTFAIASGALPPGLTLGAATGLISGTPTTVGTFSFTIRLSDPEPSSTDSPTISITIVQAPPP
ncbi:MAG TPA: putative Ig domain-containing protein [Blastocatellia bacterium]|nr:putative Ig domain-containing protein [Blastocatellia bacterium]